MIPSLEILAARGAAVVVALLMLVGPAAALDKFSFGTSWLPDAERGGFYQAKATGVYEKYGLDVTLVAGGPQTNNPQLLLAGKLDGVSISSALQGFSYIKDSVPLVSVAAIFQKTPQILMAHKSQGYKSLADLKGKPIMVSALARIGYWPWLKFKYGYDDDQIRPYTFNLGAFVRDQTVIQQAYVTSEPYAVRKEGADPAVFMLADYGFKDYASLMTFRRDSLANRDLVQRFVDASLEGWRTFLWGDAAPGRAMIKEINTQMTDDQLDSAMKSLKEYGILDSGEAAAMGLGAMTEAHWKALFDDMSASGLFDPSLDWKAAFDLSFVNKKTAMPR